MDNCIAYKEVSGLQAIRVQCLSPNTISFLQPIDQETVKCFERKIKVFFQRVILGVEWEEHCEIDILDEVHF